LSSAIAALAARHTKTQAIKQGMMQELLTGRIRLTISEDSSQDIPMLDAETLHTIHNIPVKERIALIMTLVASLDPQQAQTIQPAFLSLIDSWPSQPSDNQAPFERWKASVLPCLQQTATASEQPKRPAFGFMKGTGSIHGDIISPAVPASDWEVLQ
jgi:hypothetical protein